MMTRFSTLILGLMVLGLVIITGSAWAADGDDESGGALTFTLDNASFITVETGTPSGHVDMDGSGFSQNKVAQCSWVVNCNNGFDINFNGSSNTDLGVSQAFPTYTKLDYDASGATIETAPSSGEYEHDSLVTTFGVLITGHESVESEDNWGGGASAGAGDPEDLVLALAGSGSPDEAIGTIMTADDTGDGKTAGTATVSLYAKGVASQGTQSGVYTASATLTVTIDEQGSGLD